MSEDYGPKSERRREPRLRCADQIVAEVQEGPKRWRRLRANLKEISSSGACFEIEEQLNADTIVRLTCQDFRVIGTVRHCVTLEAAYSIGVEFLEGKKWTRGRFWPKRLTDSRAATP
ncbi:MAG: PilZ domain-containing protein [Acidobacteriales bacterium]|nr:PilZ domain-containing protein [Terriglobales bacterium]